MAIFNEAFLKNVFTKYEYLDKNDIKKCQDAAEKVIRGNNKISDCYEKTNVLEEYKIYKSAKSPRWPVPIIQVYPYSASNVKYGSSVKDIMDDAKDICSKIQKEIGNDFIVSSSRFADNKFYQILIKSNKTK